MYVTQDKDEFQTIQPLDSTTPERSEPNRLHFGIETAIQHQLQRQGFFPVCRLIYLNSSMTIFTRGKCKHPSAYQEAAVERYFSVDNFCDIHMHHTVSFAASCCSAEK